jgi:hypothetical protein
LPGNFRETAGQRGACPTGANGPRRGVSAGQRPRGGRVGLYAGFIRHTFLTSAFPGADRL